MAAFRNQKVLQNNRIWTQLGKDIDGEADDWFGSSVAITGNEKMFVAG
jgi:hypothetical protein